jgi:GWxTD domain-containing protein
MIVAILNILPGAAIADETSKPLSISLDCVQFLASDQRPYLEIFYSLPESQILYVPDGAGGFSCQIAMALQIFHEETLWASKLWKIEKSLKDTSALGGNLQIVDMLRYVLEKPGQYRVTLHAKDVNRQQIDSASVSFTAHDFSAGKAVALSDLELASSIEKLAPESTGVFAKNTMEIVPNPGLLYGEHAPKLYYYFEAYRLLGGVPGSRYKARCLIKDSGNKIVEGLMNPDRTKKKAFDSSVELGLVDVSSLASGIYTLVCGIADSVGQLLASREKKFYIYNPGVVPVPTPGLAPSPGSFGPLDLLSEAELDKEFEMMQYVTAKEERKFFKNLQNIAAKREFIFSIWLQPRPNQPLSGLAFRQQYLERVQEANAQYGSALRQGWKADRGRVYILYGPPSNIERFPSTQETKPYEIWTYHELQGGAEFIFADRYGFKNYELIHSTLRGELSNLNWRDLIETKSGATPR